MTVGISASGNLPDHNGELVHGLKVKNPTNGAAGRNRKRTTALIFVLAGVAAVTAGRTAPGNLSKVDTRVGLGCQDVAVTTPASAELSVNHNEHHKKRILPRFISRIFFVPDSDVFHQSVHGLLAEVMLALVLTGEKYPTATFLPESAQVSLGAFCIAGSAFFLFVITLGVIDRATRAIRWLRD